MLVGALLLIRFLPRAAVMQGLILQSQVGRADTVPHSVLVAARGSWLEGDRLEAHSAANSGGGQTRPEPRSIVGAMGVALSDLRPAGVAEIAGERVDVVTRGDYIAEGNVIEVVLDEGYRRVVRRAKQD
jgi:membrane-bound serine protease (ClpP class)